MRKILLLLIVVFAYSCGEEVAKTETSKLNIVVSKDSRSTVSNWLKGIDSTINITVVYDLPLDSAMQILKSADGVVITGGDDINPINYNKPDYDKYCEGYDNRRDTLEINMINYAMANKIALLGICRGHQIMNAANGGTLIPDIETFFKIEEKVHRQSKAKDSVHTIIPTKNSWIPAKFHKDGQEIYVNSIHHQSVENLSNLFELQATAKDGVVESMIAKDTTLFAIGVQWHPELERDELATYLGQIFLEASNK